MHNVIRIHNVRGILGDCSAWLMVCVPDRHPTGHPRGDGNGSGSGGRRFSSFQLLHGLAQASSPHCCCVLHCMAQDIVRSCARACVRAGVCRWWLRIGHSDAGTNAAFNSSRLRHWLSLANRSFYVGLRVLLRVATVVFA